MCSGIGGVFKNVQQGEANCLKGKPISSFNILLSHKFSYFLKAYVGLTF